MANTTALWKHRQYLPQSIILKQLVILKIAYYAVANKIICSLGGFMVN